MQQFFRQHGSEIPSKDFEHLYISGLASIIGIIIVAPLGVLLTRFPKAATIMIGLTSASQTIPSLALLALMIPLFGVGKLSATVAPFIYSLLPILRNTYVGIENINWNYRGVTKGMGMTKSQSIFSVELPTAMSTVMAGVRLAVVYVIAWATFASHIGADGLGDLIFNGLNNYQPDLILAGATPITILALLADWLLGLLEHWLTPTVLKEENDEWNVYQK